MYAVEFEAAIKKGIVHVPAEFSELQEKESARFVVMYSSENEQNNKTKSKKAKISKSGDMFFDKFNIDFSGFRFDREEANER